MQLDQFIDVEQFILEVEGELNDIDEAMRTQTARTAYYGIQYGRAQKQAATVKLTLNSVEATLVKKYRTQLEQAARDEVEGSNKQPTRVTVEMVKAAAHVDPAYLQYAKLLIEADEIEMVCRVAYDAFKTRRDMLVSLGHLKSAQLKSNVTIQGAKDSVGGYHARRAAREAQPPVSQPAG
jgi:hypothetical protein